MADRVAGHPDAFGACRALEDEMRARVAPFLSRHYRLWAYLPPTQDLQVFGDILARPRNAICQHTIEYKAEYRASPNLFLETWSNLNTRREGWLRTSEATWLWYWFKDTDHLVTLLMQPLREMFATSDHGFREAPQQKYSQRNDTRGLLVPVQWLDTRTELGIEHYSGQDIGRAA